jgi:hypothetical protein
MALPFSMPPYVANPEEAWEHRMEIECYNLGTECLGAVLVDDSFWLEGHEASNSFFLIPRDSATEIPFSTASFYADCIGFEHDFSALAIPPSGTYLNDVDIPWPCWFKAFRDPTPSEDFVRSLREAAEVANTLWNGLGVPIAFRYDWLDHPTEEVDGYDVVRVNWEGRYSGVRHAIHLYCAALRQVDPLTAYLCFYRIIENCSGNNGKSWIEAVIEDGLDTQSIAWCECPPDSIVPAHLADLVRSDNLSKTHHEREWTNLFEIFRAMAVQRRDELKQQLSAADIARRLYNENRCGIAHGGDIRTHDLATDFREVLQDLKLLRFLSRIAIEQSINEND